MAILGLLLALLAGWIFPETWWGTHYLKLLDAEQLALLVFGLVVTLTLPISAYNWLLDTIEKWTGRWFIVLISLAYGGLAYANPIAYDPYGDAIYFYKGYGNITTDATWPLKILLSVSLDAWAGQESFLALVELVSFVFKVKSQVAFRIIAATVGVLFSFVWLGWVLRVIRSNISKISLSILGLVSPFAIIFFGRTEIYSLPIFLSLCWGILLIEYFRKPNGSRLLGLYITSILAFKFHPIGLLMTPAVLIATIAHFTKKQIGQLGRWKLAVFVLVPIFLIGSGIYFFVLEDHVDNRIMSGDKVMQYDHLFLPLFSPAPPRHNYNLFSSGHIVDFINVLLLMAPAVWLGIGNGVRRISNLSEESKDALVLLSITLVLFLALFFMINPLLGLPLDWDIYTLAIPILLCILTLLHRFDLTVDRWLMTFSILSGSFILVHTDVNRIADRLELIGFRLHGTYYEWSASVLNRSVEIRTITTEQEISIRKEQIQRIESRSDLSKDQELSALYKELGKTFLRKGGDAAEAEKLLLKAKSLNSGSKNNILLLVEAYFVQEKFRLAFHEAKTLLNYRNLATDKALSIIVHCALEAELYSDAEQYAKLGTSETLNKVYQRLYEGDRVDELKLLFLDSSDL